MRAKSRLASPLLLAVLLLVAHIGVAVHVFEHDADTAQSKVCSVCITAAQLSAASVGSLALDNVVPPPATYTTTICPCRKSPTPGIARQRGPPVPS